MLYRLFYFISFCFVLRVCSFTNCESETREGREKQTNKKIKTVFFFFFFSFLFFSRGEARVCAHREKKKKGVELSLKEKREENNLDHT